MSDDPGPTQAQPNATVTSRIDMACDEFETAWRQNRHPRIEDYLDRVPPDHLPRLFRELLEVELALRQQRGDAPSVEPYRLRFPDQAELVDFLFRKVVKRRLGDYELLEEIGRGGMGVVYKARQVHLNQIAAVKVLPERCLGDSQAVSRFKREMQSVGALDHPNIVRAYNAGEEKGTHFLVTEYVDGVTLQGLVAQHKALPVGAACELVRQAAVGLQYAHEHGLVHRDVKPANLMLSRTGVVKLLDLGLARFQAGQLSQELTQAGTAMGTVDYMAPEQWENPSAVDIRADIYSLGCTLFHLLAGKPPYSSESFDTPRKKLAAHMAAPIPLVSQHCPGCPEDLDKILAHMLAKDAADRFDRPGEVAETLGLFADAAELAGFLPGQGTMADQSKTVAEMPASPGRPEPPLPAPRRSSRRLELAAARKPPKPWPQRALARVAVGLLVATLLGLLAAWWLWPDRRRAELLCDLYTLPGLNCLGAPGGWWFEQAPWLTPFAREAIVRRLDDSGQLAELLRASPAAGWPFMSPNIPEVHKWLQTLLDGAAMSEAQTRLTETLRRIPQQHRTNAELASLLAASLARFAQDHAPGEPWSAVDLHTRAVLEHKLAWIGSDPLMAQQARQSYEEALAAYACGPRGWAPLGALCQLDLSWLFSQRIDDYRAMMDCFDRAAALAGASKWFRAHVLASRGVAACARDNYQEGTSLLQEALEILGPSHWSEVSHPFVAHVHERHAWSLIYQWQVDDAVKHFQEALAIRTRWKSSNELAEIYALHCQHGIAMGQRLRGDPEWARSQFEQVLKQIQQDLREAQKQPADVNLLRYRTLLQERQYNSAERRGDCELYQGAASDPQSVSLDDACAFYLAAKEAAADNDAAIRAAMSYKLAIALALKNQPDAAKAGRREFQQAEALVAKKALGPEKKRLQLLRRIADGVLARQELGLPAAKQKLQRVLQDLNGSRLSAKEKDRCEIQELYLFCAEFLLASALRESAAVDPSDWNHLAGLLAAFPEQPALRRQLCPYLRRYYELAIEACQEGDPTRLAGCVLFSRCQQRADDATTIVFFFQDRAIRQKRNFAVGWSPEGRCVLATLDWDRATVLKPPPERAASLAPELRKLLDEDRRLGHPYQVSWSDEVCWYDPSLAIQDKHWPFRELALQPLKEKR